MYNSHLTRYEQSDSLEDEKVQLVTCFGAKKLLQRDNVFDFLKRKFFKANIVICSTAGEIYNNEVYDNSLSVAAVQFEDTPLQSHNVEITDFDNSFDAGKALIEKFEKKDLNYVLVFSDGSKVNGSELVRGMNTGANHEVLITGGLAGDGSEFNSTLVGLNFQPREGVIAAIGFYGDKLKVNHGSQGGWEKFGPERIVTKSFSNELLELDDKNALEIYKRYLGPDAERLPGSALLFPLSLQLPDSDEPIVRTILSINEEKGSMVFAGDIPQGSQVRFMKANFDKLTYAASKAAVLSQDNIEMLKPPKFAILVSCVGRKLVLQSRIDEEVEAVNEVFNHKTMLTGFYSYGEISPLAKGASCQLHNQTMTITTFDEA